MNKETLLENLHKLANKATEERRALKTGEDGYDYLCGYEYGLACAIGEVIRAKL